MDLDRCVLTWALVTIDLTKCLVYCCYFLLCFPFLAAKQQNQNIFFYHYCIIGNNNDQKNAKKIINEVINQLHSMSNLLSIRFPSNQSMMQKKLDCGFMEMPMVSSLPFPFIFTWSFGIMLTKFRNIILIPDDTFTEAASCKCTPLAPSLFQWPLGLLAGSSMPCGQLKEESSLVVRSWPGSHSQVLVFFF